MEGPSFLETDAEAIYETVITSLERNVSEALYPGDERRIFGDALVAVFVAAYNDANDACRMKMLQFARGEVLDALGARLQCYRIEAKPAETRFRFSVKSAISGNIMIQEGTRVTSDFEVYFKTTETAVLQAGSMYVDVPAVSVGVGEKYNDYLPGTINQLVDLVPYIDFVENIDITSGADNGEPYPDKDGGIGDDHYRKRIELAPTALSVAGPRDAYEYHVKSADASIVDVSILSDIQTVHYTVPVYHGKAFVGGEGYNVSTLQVEGAVENTDYTVEYQDYLLVITLSEEWAEKKHIEISIDKDLAGHVLITPIMEGGKIPSQDVLNKVYEACSAEDVRPMTDKLIVQKPKQIEYDIDIIYFSSVKDEAECIRTIEGKDGAIDMFREWQDTKMGRAINPDKLRALCLSPENGVGCSRIQVLSPDYRELKETEVAKCKRVTVRHQVEV